MTYYQSATLSGPRKLQRNQNAVRFKPSESGLGPISNALIIGAMVSILGIMYLTQVTKTSSYGYEVNKLQSNKQELVENNQSLLVESARLQALDRIKSSEVAKNLSEPANVEYVQ